MPYRPKYKNANGNLEDLPIEAETAVKLKTSRTIGLSGVTATAKSFNGTGSITIPITAVPASLLTGDVHAKTVENAVLENDGTYSGLTVNSSGILENGNRVVKTKTPLYVGTIGTATTDYTILSGNNFPTVGKSYEVVYEDNGCKKIFQIVFPKKPQTTYAYVYFSLMFGVGSNDYDYQINTSSSQTYKVIRWKIDHTNSKVMQTKLSAGSCASTSPYFRGIYELKEEFGS